MKFHPLTKPSQVAVILAIIATVASLWSLRQESIVTDYQQRLDNQILPDGTMHRPDFLPLPAFAPPRALVAEALYRARVASTMSDTVQRRIQLTEARTATIGAADSRPHWGEAWVVRAYVESLASPRFGEREKKALIRSYLDAPFLYPGGFWRTRQGILNWNAFPGFARDRIADEMVWLIRLSGGQKRSDLLEFVRNSSAYRAVFARLRPTDH